MARVIVMVTLQLQHQKTVGLNISNSTAKAVFGSMQMDAEESIPTRRCS